MAKYKAMNAVSSGSENRPRRFRDDNGFLHIFLRFMRTGILEYGQDTFPDGIPSGAAGVNGRVAVMVEPDDLKDPESLASLAGMPGLRKHEWATPEQDLDQIGAVAGEPCYVEENGVGYVECEAVITDAETIGRLDDGELVEVSSGYRHDVDWAPGEFEGKSYAGKQKGLRYNHFVLLPEGEGRAGRDVRALNAKENEVADEKEKGGVRVWCRKLKRAIFALNAEDAEAIAELDEKPEEKTESTDGNPPPKAGEGGDKPPAEGEGGGEIKNLSKLLDELTKVKARAAELEGQLQVAQERINELLSSDKVEQEAEALSSEREEAAGVIAENCGIDKAKAMNAIKEAKLRGHALRVHAMNSIREHQGKQKIEDEKTKDEAFILGMWNGVKEGVGQKKVVVGGIYTNAQAMNAAQDYRKQALAALGFDVK
jgi:hypothetical protein